MVVALVAAVVVAALWPLWRTAAASRLLRLGLTTLGLATVVATALAPAPAGPDAALAAALRPAVVVQPGYAGSASCRSCHPGEHASWHGSFHRTMSQLATRETVAAQIEGDDLTVDWFGSPVHFRWHGERLHVRFRRGGNEPADVDAPIEQLTGSHHLQVLWYGTGRGRELAPVPVCYKIEERIWLPVMAVFVLPPEHKDPPEPGIWSESCSMCHATATRPRIDIGRNDTHVGELGIACEACHGPGAAHVAANRDPLRRWSLRRASAAGEGSDDTIVEPSQLPPARSAEVCGHCHSVSILRAAHFDSWREEGSPYRPGDNLQATHRVIGPSDRDAPELRREVQREPRWFTNRFWPDGQVRLSGREFNGLVRSPCATHGDAARQLDCTSCHAMHTEDGEVDGAWRAGQMDPAKAGNAGCTQCHAAFAEPSALVRHTRHAPESGGSNCYNCHMSHTSVGLMKASRSHEITSPDVNVELATGRPNACSQCHLDRPLSWVAERLQADWGVAAPALDDEQRTVAAGVRWLLTGDAGLRLLAAWSFGWPEAQRASGTDWMAPYLARLLDDPYHVVRFRAARSLGSIAGYAPAMQRYEFLGPLPGRRAVIADVEAIWEHRRPRADRPAVLLRERGLDREAFGRLHARRDDRPVYLAE
jgi:hypothetical protein